MSNGEPPTDWQWEEDKAKAAISRNVVMTDEEKEAAYRSIENKYAHDKGQWDKESRELTASELDERIDSLDVLEASEEQPETKKPTLGNEDLARMNWESAVKTEAARRAKDANQSIPSSAPKGRDQSEIDTEALAGSFSRNHKEKFNTIREAKERQQEEFEKKASQYAHARTEYRHELGIRAVQADAAAKPAIIDRVIVRANDVQNELPSVARPLKFAIESALLQIDQYRKDVCQNNMLCAEHPEFLEHLLHTLDDLASAFNEINAAIPENTEVVSKEEAEKVAGVMERFKNQGTVELQRYFSPESLVKAAFPTGIVLTCGFVGSMFGPIGAGIGALTGKVFTNSAPTDAVLKELNKIKEVNGSETTEENADSGS